MAKWVQELHFPHLEIPVTIDRIDPILPDSYIPEKYPNGLYLSNLDDMVGVRVFTPTVYFYRPSPRADSVARVLKDALRALLVPYFPFTGRLRETANGKLEVFFSGDRGALFVEAHSDDSLSELGELRVPNPAWINLIYRFPNEGQYRVVDMPLLIAQVTRFRCGGFSLGLRMCHCLCDGLGAMQFLGAWAQTARDGSVASSTNPCWDREVFKPRSPLNIQFEHAEFKSVDEGRSTLTASLWEKKPVQKCYRISREFQARLKCLARESGSGGGSSSSYTTFDSVSAHVWRSWVKALDVKPPDCDLRLTFSVNARAKLTNPPLKEGFYGNALCVACAASKVEKLVGGRLAEVTRLVNEARLGITEEYVRSTVDYIELYRPRRLEFGGKLTITQWTRFSIYESADFGFGAPVYAGPIDLTPTPQVGLFLPEGGAGDSNGGAVVLCICLPEFACERFKELLCSMDA